VEGHDQKKIPAIYAGRALSNLFRHQWKWNWCFSQTLSPPFDNIWSYGDCLEVKREYYHNCFTYCQRATSPMGTDNKRSSYSAVGPWVFLFVFLGSMIYLYVAVCNMFCFTSDSWVFPFLFWRWRNKLKWAPFELFAHSSLLWVRSWLHPYKGIVNKKPMRDEAVNYVAAHPLLIWRFTRLPGCFYFPKRKL